MVLIECYYYVIDIDISRIDLNNYYIISTNTYIDNNEVFEIKYKNKKEFLLNLKYLHKLNELLF